MQSVYNDTYLTDPPPVGEGDVQCPCHTADSHVVDLHHGRADRGGGASGLPVRLWGPARWCCCSGGLCCHQCQLKPAPGAELRVETSNRWSGRHPSVQSQVGRRHRSSQPRPRDRLWGLLSVDFDRTVGSHCNMMQKKSTSYM